METTYTAMGRFGNVLLVGGEQDCTLTATAGEVVRLWLTNTANTRVFHVTLPEARMKLVGGDSGRVEHEQFVSSVILAPSERVVIDVLFDQPGQLELQHRAPDRTYRLASIIVTGGPATPPLAEQLEALRTAPELAAEREFFETWLEATPDKTLALIAEMDDITAPGQGPVLYACPMHPEVTSAEPGRCPESGMKLFAAAAATTYACPMHPEVTSDQPGRLARSLRGAGLSGAALAGVGAAGALVSVRAAYPRPPCTAPAEGWPPPGPVPQARLTVAVVLGASGSLSPMRSGRTRSSPALPNSSCTRWAYAFLVSYQAFYLLDKIGSTQADVPQQIFLGTLAQSAVIVAASVIGGRLSDRTGRRKIFVLTASVVCGLALFVIAIASNFNGFLVGMAIGGLGFGVYVAVDLALVVDVLHDKVNAAKDLGVFNIAGALPFSIAPAIAPVILAMGGGSYGVLYAVAGLCAIIGAFAVLPVKRVR